MFIKLPEELLKDTNLSSTDKILLGVILSYQGRREWQSPVEPKTIEAVLLHTINYMDSQVNFMSRNEE